MGGGRGGVHGRSSAVCDDGRSPHQIAYSDASPLLILSQASLADLNSRLEKKVKAANFRPNIVISGCGVYAEVRMGSLPVFLGCNFLFLSFYFPKV